MNCLIFSKRLKAAEQVAQKYCDSFPSPLRDIFVNHISYILGVLVLFFVICTLIGDQFSQLTIGNHTLLFCFAVLSALLAGVRSLSPSPSSTSTLLQTKLAHPYDPLMELESLPTSSVYFEQLLSYFHLYPSEWQHLSQSQCLKQVKSVYITRLQTFIQELLSILYLPYILFICLPAQVPQIVSFFQETTVDLPGVGVVSSYALLQIQNVENDNSSAPLFKGNTGKDVSEHSAQYLSQHQIDPSISIHSNFHASQNPHLEKSELHNANSDTHMLLNSVYAHQHPSMYFQPDHSIHMGTSYMHSTLARSSRPLFSLPHGQVEKSLLAFSMHHPSWPINSRAAEGEASGGIKFLSNILHPSSSIAAVHHDTNEHSVSSSSSSSRSSTPTVPRHDPHPQDADDYYDHEDVIGDQVEMHSNAPLNVRYSYQALNQFHSSISSKTNSSEAQVLMDIGGAHRTNAGDGLMVSFADLVAMDRSPSSNVASHLNSPSSRARRYSEQSTLSNILSPHRMQRNISTASSLSSASMHRANPQHPISRTSSSTLTNLNSNQASSVLFDTLMKRVMHEYDEDRP